MRVSFPLVTDVPKFLLTFFSLTPLRAVAFEISSGPSGNDTLQGWMVIHHCRYCPSPSHAAWGLFPRPPQKGDRSCPPTPASCCQSPADLNLSPRPFPLSLGGGMKAGISGPYTSTSPDSCVQDQDRPSRAHRSPRPPVSSVNGSQTHHPSGTSLHSPGWEVGTLFPRENLH